MSAFPSPFQSPITGYHLVSPELDSCRILPRQSFHLSPGSRYHCSVGRSRCQSFPSPFQSPITGISSGKPRTQTRIGTFPGKVPIRVQAPDTTARSEDPDVIFSIAIPVADNGSSSGKPRTQSSYRNLPRQSSHSSPGPDTTARSEYPDVIFSIAIPVADNRDVHPGSPQ